MSNPQKIHKLKNYISFFEVIPEERWCTGSLHYGGRSCALGHLANSSDGERLSANDLMLIANNLIHYVNDNKNGRYGHYGSTPKQRVLTYLKTILNNELIKEQ